MLWRLYLKNVLYLFIKKFNFKEKQNMSLNLKIEILSDKKFVIGEVEIPQINTENTLMIIGNDNNLNNQVDRLIHYFETNKLFNEYIKKAQNLKGLTNLRFTFV